jgi:hypothetical protein
MTGKTIGSGEKYEKDVCFEGTFAKKDNWPSGTPKRYGAGRRGGGGPKASAKRSAR